MTFSSSLRVRWAFVCLSAIPLLSVAATTTTVVDHDPLNRVTTLAEGPSASRIFSYDPSGNRTNHSATLGFSVTGFANEQVAAETAFSIPLATVGSLSASAAQWTVRSSNHQLVPKSGLQILGAGTGSPTVELTPAPGATGTTRITVIASDGDVAAATSFVLTVGGNRPPRAITDTVEHPPGASTRVETRRFLLNDSDPDGDLFSMTALSAGSAHGGIVEFFGPFVRYAPPAGYDGPDLFHYTLDDSHGATATGTVTVIAQAPSLVVPITVVAIEMLPNDHRLIHFIGPWNTTFEIQASSDMVHWTPVGTSVSDSQGRYTFEDSEAELYPERFYRSVHQ